MTSRHYIGSATPDATKRYASDLNDREFALIAPHDAQKDGSGKKRTVDSREVLNAIFYRTRTGCQWRLLPTDFPACITSGTITGNGVTCEHAFVCGY